MKSQRFFLAKDVDSYVNLRAAGKDRHYRYYELKMADCARTVSWEFAATTPEEAKASLKKLKKFRDLVNELYTALENEHA